jgi:PAS domain S-box-containing protein
MPSVARFERLQPVPDDAVLVELLPFAAYMFHNETYAFLAVNGAALDLYGYSRNEFLQMTAEQIRPADQRLLFREMFLDHVHDEKYFGTQRHQKKNGESFDADVISQPVVYRGQPAHFVVLFDSTERHRHAQRVEQQLRESHAQLRRIAARGRARREEDRTRLARELHDQLGQSLTALKIELCSLGGSVAAARVEPGDVIGRLDSMTRLVDETIERVRRISSELRPPVLDRLGLVAAIEWQSKDFECRTRIHTRVRSNVEELPLDRGRSTTVFRIVQEALTNVASHAQATTVTVQVRASRDRLRLTIADNGRGIAIKRSSGERSLGLLGMKERAEQLGGTLAIQRARPSGTIVSVAIPLAERRRRPRHTW